MLRTKLDKKVEKCHPASALRTDLILNWTWVRDLPDEFDVLVPHMAIDAEIIRLVRRKIGVAEIAKDKGQTHDQVLAVLVLASRKLT
jgi:hypothetical protein